MAHTDGTTTVTLRYIGTNQMGTSCAFDRYGEGKLKDRFWIRTDLLDDGEFNPELFKEGALIDVEVPVWLAMKEGLI